MVEPLHPAEIAAGPARVEAIEKWCAAGWDPHMAPHSPPVTSKNSEDDDRSIWALVLTGRAGLNENSASALQTVLKAGAEPHRPVRVPGGVITPLMAVLSGPLEEVGLKVRLLRAAGQLATVGRWPGETDLAGDAPIHLLVSAQPSGQVDLRQAIVETMIVDLFEDIMGSGLGVASVALLRDRRGALALHRALALGRYDVALRLLQVAPAAQAAAVDHHGNGAFHALAHAGWHPMTSAGLMRVARDLGTHGAQWHAPNLDGVSALDAAINQSKTPEETAAWRGLAQRTAAGPL